MNKINITFVGQIRASAKLNLRRNCIRKMVFLKFYRKFRHVKLPIYLTFYKCWEINYCTCSFHTRFHSGEADGNNSSAPHAHCGFSMEEA